jgi:hypothetical protein
MRVQGRPGPFLVTLLDISATGFRFSSPTALPAGARVTIKCLGAEIAGEVRYARPMEGVFHIGVLAENLPDTNAQDLVKLFRPRVS